MFQLELIHTWRSSHLMLFFSQNYKRFRFKGTTQKPFESLCENLFHSNTLETFSWFLLLETVDSSSNIQHFIISTHTEGNNSMNRKSFCFCL